MKDQSKISFQCLLVLAGAVFAFFPTRVWGGDFQIHGSGGWAFGITGGKNNYLVGNEDGSYTNSYFALNISGSPEERLSVNAQTIWKTSDEGMETDIEYVFADWTFFDWLKLRIGKVKCPFGLYSEIYDVGTLRPFYTLPTSLYATPGQVTESYYGLGLTGRLYPHPNWGLQYDLYGGEIFFKETVMSSFKSVMPDPMQPVIRDSSGLRLIVYTPLDGLNIGFAEHIGDTRILNVSELAKPFIAGEGWYLTYLLSAEYLTDRFSVRSEYSGSVKLKGGREIKTYGYYLEAAVKFWKHWQVAGIYDVQKMTMPEGDMPFTIAMPEDHHEGAFGLNYWFSPNFVLKSSYHYVRGNLFAAEDQTLEQILSGYKMDEVTHLFIFSAQFSF
ncbi:MAG: porin [bacterium]|nr:porin [bacterium]